MSASVLALLTWAFFTLPADPSDTTPARFQRYDSFPTLIACERAARQIEQMSRWRLIASDCYPQIERTRDLQPVEANP